MVKMNELEEVEKSTKKEQFCNLNENFKKIANLNQLEKLNINKQIFEI